MEYSLARTSLQSRTVFEFTRPLHVLLPYFMVHWFSVHVGLTSQWTAIWVWVSVFLSRTWDAKRLTPAFLFLS